MPNQHIQSIINAIDDQWNRKNAPSVLGVNYQQQQVPHLDRIRNTLTISGQGLTDLDMEYFLGWCSLVRNSEFASNVKRIDLSSNSLTILPQLSCFENLMGLNISDNKIKALPTEIQLSLKSINLNNNEIDSLTSFPSNHNLRFLTLNENNFTKIGAASIGKVIENQGGGVIISYDINVNLDPGLFNDDNLKDYFSYLLARSAPKNTNLMHYIALVLARLEILPAVINAKIMSFLYDNNIADEIEKLLELFPDKQQDINNFVDAEPNKQCGLYYMQENYKTKKLAKLATIAENVASPKEAPGKTRIALPY